MKKSDHLFQPGGPGTPWYAWVYETGEDGERKQVRRSTRCKDRPKAEAVLRKWEGEARDPKIAEKRGATLADAFANLHAKTEAKAERGARSTDTIGFQKKQARSWYLFAGLVLEHPKVKTEKLPKSDALDDEEKVRLRKEGEGFPLARVDGGLVDEFIQWRERNGIGGTTLGKDLAVLRPAMRYAMRAGQWAGSLEAVFPRHELNYQPSERWITVDEFRALLARGKLEPHRAAVLCFAMAAGAEARAVERALREDVADAKATVVRVRGTKRETRDRVVPIITAWQRELLDYVRKHATGTEGKLFGRWSNQRRVIGEACERAKIEPVNITALRHSYAHAMKAEGVRQEDLAVAMGHRDTTMLDAVYAKATTPKELVERFRAASAERQVALQVIEGGKAKKAKKTA
jgi:integrase